MVLKTAQHPCTSRFQYASHNICPIEWIWLPQKINSCTMSSTSMEWGVGLVPIGQTAWTPSLLQHFHRASYACLLVHTNIILQKHIYRWSSNIMIISVVCFYKNLQPLAADPLSKKFEQKLTLFQISVIRFDIGYIFLVRMLWFYNWNTFACSVNERNFIRWQKNHNQYRM